MNEWSPSLTEKMVLWESLDADLQPFVSPETGPWLEGYGLFYVATSADAVVGDRVRRAALAGLDIWFQPGVGGLGASLDPLADAADVIRGLAIKAFVAVTGSRVLERMSQLERLTIEDRVDEVVDLSMLPRLSQFSGLVSRNTRSVFSNPRLRSLTVMKPLTTAVVVEAPLEHLMIFGAKPTSAEVVLRQPEYLVSYIRKFCRGGFDLNWLERSPHLRWLKIDDFDEVRGMSVLTRFGELESLHFGGGRIEEPWTDLLGMTATDVWLFMEPVPRDGTLDRLSALGWHVPALDLEPEAESLAIAGPIRIDRDDEGALLMLEVAEAVDLISERERTQLRWDAARLDTEVARIATTAGASGGDASVHFDSEGDLVVARFDRADDALRVARTLAKWLGLTLDELGG